MTGPRILLGVWGVLRDLRFAEPVVRLDLSTETDWVAAPFRVWGEGRHRLLLSSVNHDDRLGSPPVRCGAFQRPDRARRLPAPGAPPRRDEHGMTELMRAAGAGDAAEARRLAEGGARLDQRVRSRPIRELFAVLMFFQQLPAQSPGYSTVQFAGEAQTKRIHFAAYRLKYSRWMDVVIVPNERVEALVRALLVSFERSGGVPLRVVFDRPRTVVVGTDEIARCRYDAYPSPTSACTRPRTSSLLV